MMVHDLNMLDDIVSVEGSVLCVGEDHFKSRTSSDLGSCDGIDPGEETDERDSRCLSVCEGFLEVGRLVEEEGKR